MGGLEPPVRGQDVGQSDSDQQESQQRPLVRRWQCGPRLHPVIGWWSASDRPMERRRVDHLDVQLAPEATLSTAPKCIERRLLEIVAVPPLG